jgi:hypothetical protein
LPQLHHEFSLPILHTCSCIRLSIYLHVCCARGTHHLQCQLCFSMLLVQSCLTSYVQEYVTLTMLADFCIWYALCIDLCCHHCDSGYLLPCCSFNYTQHQ